MSTPGSSPSEIFYKLVFSNYGVGFWLNWLAMVLALISTAGIIPDLIAGGSVDLYLCKPISRLRLFLTKYAHRPALRHAPGLLFSAACFLLIRASAAASGFHLFLAVPAGRPRASATSSRSAVLLGLLTRVDRRRPAY